MSLKANPTSKSSKSSANAGRRRICFEVDAELGSQVSVAGSFNSWNPEAHVFRPAAAAGHFKRIVYLEPGDYEYKFVIDGNWSADPNCPSFAANTFGTLNSVLEVFPAKPGKS